MCRPDIQYHHENEYVEVMFHMNQMFQNATAFKQNVGFWGLTNTLGVPTFTNMLENSGLVGNAFGLTTPTPLKSQFNQIRPGEPLFNNTIVQAVNDFIANPNAGQFTNQNNFPFFDVITKWNVSQVTSMNSLFLNKTLFNDDISGWDVSNVLDMTSMFEGATSFNIDISKWVVNKVINMNRMFVNASSFNHTIQYWLLIPTADVPTFENMLGGSGLVGNIFGLTVPTPLKSEFNQKRPGEPIFNDKLPTIVNDWIANERGE